MAWRSGCSFRCSSGLRCQRSSPHRRPRAKNARRGYLPSQNNKKRSAATWNLGELVAPARCTEIWLDDKKTGQRTPLIGYKVGCGRHTLSLRREDLALSQVERIEAVPGTTVLRTIILR